MRCPRSHRYAPFRSVLPDSFEIEVTSVAESQVIGALQVAMRASLVRESGYPRLRNPRSTVVSSRLGRRSSSRKRRVTSRLRNPRSSVLSLLSARYFQVADSNAIASQVMAEFLS